MSDRKWKPGDVARINVSAEGAVGIWTGEFWAWSNGDGPYEGVSHCHASVDARPLVVIDPEDEVAMERLRDALGGDFYYGSTGTLQAALREFADPKPRIEEPTGLGAVVEDDKGERWIRWEIVGRHPLPWTVPGALEPNRSYDQINAVRVLSEGVTA